MHRKTIFITGASSGIGRATAELFLARGWNVAATMRAPKDASALLQEDPNCVILPCDVTQEASIQDAIDHTLQRFGRVDAVLNNAGYGLIGIFEGMTDDQIRRQFDVNVMGVMAVTRAWLPHLRDHGGTILTVSSMGGLLTFPLYSVYHSTKWAVEGFMESLQFELAHLNIRIKLIEPGAITTDFYTRSMEVIRPQDIEGYDRVIDRALPKMNTVGATGYDPSVVAKTIYRAATDNTKKLRYAASNDAKAILFLRRLLPNRFYMAMVKRRLLS